MRGQESWQGRAESEICSIRFVSVVNMSDVVELPASPLISNPSSLILLKSSIDTNF